MEAQATAPAPPATEPPAATSSDPAAPYGRFANGKPRKSPPGEATKKKKTRSSSSGSGPRPSTRRTAPKGPDYRPGILGMLQTVTIPLAFVAPADAAAVGHHGPGVAEALNDLARERPEVAAALERVMQVGPYGALIGAVVPLAVQLLHNHDVLPESMAVQLGATPKRRIMADLRAQAGGGPEPDREQPRQHPGHGPADVPQQFAGAGMR